MIVEVMSIAREGGCASPRPRPERLPPTASLDAPLASAIVALGILIAVTPSSITGLTPRCSERREEE
jgi:hypothetical protein